ncbi:MAG: right-handed parallel beta-helix repeat-containing protein [Promethearchaeota archaeon]
MSVAIFLVFFAPTASKFAGNINFESNFDKNNDLDTISLPVIAGIHDRITIDGNGALATFIQDEELSGDGTEISPYVIEDFIIDASTGNGIDIRNTNAYLIIRNCQISDGSFYYGIYLSSITNVNITNNDLHDNYGGLYMVSSNNNTLSENNVSSNDFYGFSLYSSSNITLSGNIANDNGDAGIYLSNLNTSVLFGNDVSHNDHGIYITDSKLMNLSGNTVIFNNNYGISLWYSSNNTLYKNNASFNNKVGIYYYSSSNNTVYFNDIAGNSLIQAYDEQFSIDNQWDNGTLGNYWGEDYINRHPTATNDGKVWNIPYEMNGTGEGIDYFPLAYSISEIEFTAPEFTEIAEDFTADEGYSGLFISWTATDLHPATYTIEMNEIEVVLASPWTNGNAIMYNIPNGLLKGDYEFTIKVEDKYGNSARDSVNFEIKDGVLPQFTNIPDDFSADEGYSGLSISWTATDLYPATYTIKLNGIEIVSATAWTNGTVISHNIPEDLLEDNYNITIILTDESGNIAQDTVIFTVNSHETLPTDDNSDDDTGEPGTAISGFPLMTTLIFISVVVVMLKRKMINQRI